MTYGLEQTIWEYAVTRPDWCLTHGTQMPGDASWHGHLQALPSDYDYRLARAVEASRSEA